MLILWQDDNGAFYQKNTMSKSKRQAQKNPSIIESFKRANIGVYNSEGLDITTHIVLRNEIRRKKKM